MDAEYEYDCSNGHVVAAPYELTECVVWRCDGTLHPRARRGRPPKVRTVAQPEAEQKAE